MVVIESYPFAVAFFPSVCTNTICFPIVPSCLIPIFGSMPENFNTYLSTHAALTDVQLQQLAGHLRVRTFAPQQFLLRKGDVCREAFFVEQGVLRSYSIDENGKEYIIQFAPENWFISDRSSHYFNEPSEYYIDAIEETQVVCIDRQFIQQASDLSPSFRQYNDRILHNHIRYLYKRINLLISDTAESRYLRFIQLYPDILLRVPQWMIASYLGITPESLSRVRKDLAKKNFRPS